MGLRSQAAQAAGRIGAVISAEIKKAVEITAQTRKDYNQKAALFGSSGEDSPPLQGDKIMLLKTDGTGRYAAIGIFTQTQGALPGEKIFYARDSAGEVVSKLSMLGNGDMEMDSTGKHYIGNKTGNMQELLLGLVDELIAFETFGAPPQHKTHPATVAKLEAYKEKIKALFKEAV